MVTSVQNLKKIYQGKVPQILIARFDDGLKQTMIENRVTENLI
jgi:hypothetical protein